MGFWINLFFAGILGVVILRGVVAIRRVIRQDARQRHDV